MNTEVNLCGIKMKNPVTVASGTFGYGREYDEYIDLNKLGGIITKGTSLKLRPGNKPPRICEVPGGMLNSIGLQNPGVEYFAENDENRIVRIHSSGAIRITKKALEQ